MAFFDDPYDEQDGRAGADDRDDEERPVAIGSDEWFALDPHEMNGGHEAHRRIHSRAAQLLETGRREHLATLLIAINQAETTGKWAEALAMVADVVKGQDQRIQAQDAELEILRAGSLEPLKLNEEEQRAMDGVLTAFNEILGWSGGLYANHSELTAAVHVIQGFIVQHMLSRADHGNWGTWWERDKRELEQK